jgi:phage baseplate assembly protein W
MSSKGSAIGISPKLPLSISSVDGAYGLNKTLAENARQNLKNLILTIPGERIMDPDFGVGIKRYLFENIADVQEIIPAVITKQADTYLPYITIDAVTVTGGDYDLGSEHILYVQIYYRIPSSTNSQILSLNLG